MSVVLPERCIPVTPINGRFKYWRTWQPLWVSA